MRVAAGDIAELKDILAHERPSAKDDFGPKINQWMAKIVVKASQGLVDLSMATASNVSAALICKNYGLKVFLRMMHRRMRILSCMQHYYGL